MKIGIIGCAGRMGQMLVREVLATDSCELSGGTECPSHSTLGQDIASTAGLDPCGLIIQADPLVLFNASDIVIDFSIAAITQRHTSLAVEHNTKLILGTTGHDEAEIASIIAAAEKTTIVKAMNFSIGINTLFALTQHLSETLDDDFDIEIVEMHHKHKIDAPSGTAIGLGEAAAKGRGVSLAKVTRQTRDGIIGERRRGDIGFAALRGGDVVGEHKVIFAGNSERIELGHIASSRKIFSAGAIRAALWSRYQGPGLYDMLDVLGLRE